MISNYFWCWEDEYVRGESEPDFNVLNSKWEVSIKDIIKIIESRDLDKKRLDYQKYLKDIRSGEVLFDEQEVRSRHMQESAYIQGVTIRTVKDACSNDGIVNLPLLKGLNLAMKTLKDAIDVEGKATGIYADKQNLDEVFDGKVEYIQINSQEHRQGLAKELISSGRLDQMEPNQALGLLRSILDSEPIEHDTVITEIEEDEQPE